VQRRSSVPFKNEPMQASSGVRNVAISGAGPAGLAAALTAVRAGLGVTVFERADDVGARFHDGFQGLENWTTEGDVLDELGTLGIEPTFEHAACRETVIFDPSGREHVYRSPQPIYYIVRRGSGPGTLDQSLKAQALNGGVEIRFNQACRHLPNGGIVAEGPHGADAIAVGYLFDTDAADGAYSAISDRLAAKGYAYLLVHGGRGTVASCLFDDFHREKTYLERTVDFFKDRVGVRMTNPRQFGGIGNFTVPRTARQGGLLFAGEAVGFQDALWGFGMRYALVSGHLAARAFVEGNPESYDRRWKRRFGGLLRTGIVNRYLYARLGDNGYVGLTRVLDRTDDVREWLRQHYTATVLKRALFPLASWSVRTHRKTVVCVMDGCDCTWCRCQHTVASAGGA
jgi:flavin-dependent dehydrogenase